MTSNLLCVNPSKTEFMLIGLRELKKIPNPSISLNLDSTSTHTFTPTSPVRNLGIIFDQNLNFSDHITHLPALASATFEESALCSISKLHLPSLKHHHITPVLKKLHWLKIPERIEYKAISLTYNTLRSSQPSNLRQLFTIQLSRSTRSSSALALLRPSVCLRF